MDENYHKILVKKYLDKKLTDDELEVFIHLMQQNKLDQLIQEEMDKELGLETAQEYDETPVPAIGRRYFVKWTVAATIALAFGAAFYLVKAYKTNNEALAGNMVNVFNQQKSIVKCVLPDNSAVWLQPDSHISYPSKFKGALREVNMMGDAFFEVTKDASHPFVITTGNVLTRVWGTSFRVRYIPGEKITKVSVLTGKVSVSVLTPKMVTADKNKTQMVMLKPADQATYSSHENKLQKAIGSANSDLAIWRKSNLNFDDVPLSAIVAALSNNYKVHIKVANADLNNYHITADLTGKNLADILLLVCKSVHADYTIQENEINISTSI